MEGILQNIETQTVTEPIAEKETQTEWGQQEAGTQAVVEQMTKWTQTLQVEGPEDTDLQYRDTQSVIHGPVEV
ncbi:unnamed protein product [Caretta caretta]